MYQNEFQHCLQTRCSPNAIGDPFMLIGVGLLGLIVGYAVGTSIQK